MQMNDNAKSMILAVVLVGLIASGLWVLYEESNRIATKSHDDMVLNPVFNEDHSTKTRDALTYNQIYTHAMDIQRKALAYEKQYYAINETEMKLEQSRNLTLHIAANATQNITIWKGDKLVAYIPR
jgi:hypothetical protein